MECYPPWIGPYKGRVVFFSLVLIACMAMGFIWIPIATCPAADDAGLCAGPVIPPILQALGTVGRPMLRGCPCNASATTRTETNARVLSNTVFANGELPPTPELRGLSSLAIVVAQFVLNDIVDPIVIGTYEQLIPGGDPYFSPTPANTSIPIWSALADAHGCPNPISNTTPFIDLSNVYGVDPMYLMTVLRSQHNGQLKVDPTTNLLPYDADGQPFLMADPRDGYTAGLVTMQTIMVRNHNWWATRIAHLRPDWGDEQLFWKARQMNIAEWQHVLYHEWLPALLGSEAPPVRSTLTEPSPSIPVGVQVEVAAAMMPALIDTTTPATYASAIPGQPSASISWTSQYGTTQAATLIQNEGISPMLLRLLQTPALAFDARVSNELRNIYNGTQPVDYVTWHVQRARVLRIPDWAAIYTCYGVNPIAMDPRDAYQGFLQEPIYPGSSEGLTGASLLANQFAALRDSDGNFYSFRRVEIGKLLWPEIIESSMRGILTRNGGLPSPLVSREPFFISASATP